MAQLCHDSVQLSVFVFLRTNYFVTAFNCHLLDFCQVVGFYMKQFLQTGVHMSYDIYCGKIHYCLT